MPTVLAVLKIIAALEQKGVDFTKEKMLCPLCRGELKVYKTLEWDGETRIRYHKCCVCSHSWKSVETKIIKEEKTNDTKASKKIITDIKEVKECERKCNDKHKQHNKKSNGVRKNTKGVQRGIRKNKRKKQA